MNVWLQIGLGLIPGTLIALIVMIRRRAFSPFTVLINTLLAAVCFMLVFMGMTYRPDNAGRDKLRLSKKEAAAFSYALMEQGAYEDAAELINQYSAKYGYDDELRLQSARLNLLKGNYDKAAGLYEYITDNTQLIPVNSREAVIARNKKEKSGAAVAMIDYYLSCGGTLEDYGITKTDYDELVEADRITEDDIRELVFDEIDRDHDIDDVRDYAETVSEVSSDRGHEDDDGSSAGSYKREFREMAENDPEYLDLECVSKARIRAYVSAGDYEEIAAGLDEDSTYHELMVAAELYMGGLVKKGDFSDYYHQIDRKSASDVEKRLRKNYSRLQKELNVQERKSLKQRVDAIKRQLDDPELAIIKEQLRRAAENEAGTEATKVHLEIAKIENYFGNETSMDSNLSEAIFTSQDSKDDSYAYPMSKIISVISNDEDDESEEIKNVSEYVDSVLDNSLTVDVEDVIASDIGAREYEDDEYESDEEREYTEDAEDADRQVNDFARTATDYVSRVKSSITIGRIDTSGFETVSARVQIDSDYISGTGELRQALRVYDCGAQIKDFDIRKIEFTGSNIMLVCDVSGSMSDSISDLRDAVTTFITDKNESENLAVVTFDDGIVDVRSFGTSDDSLLAFAESMSAEGGTDMFSAVLYSMDDFPNDPDENNVLILMTDGQDNSPRSSEEIYEKIGGAATAKGITVYTLGLGSDVDTSYLNTIAGSGNGDFVYVSDSSSLNSFYDMLHGQLHNQYEIKYDALDTMTVTGRTLEVLLPSENTRDMKHYSLEGEGGDGSDSEMECNITGMSPRYIYKGMQKSTVRLKGLGFKKDSVVTVRLNGNIDYNLDPVYVDAETYEMTIPQSIAAGVYNVEVNIDGKKKIIDNGFSVVVQGDEKTTQFGPYVFTSMQKIENEDTVTLSGNVVMNGWLRFKGDVVINGDYKNADHIEVSDFAGSYVEFDPATAEGFGKNIVNWGIDLPIPALGNFTLYDDKVHYYDYDKYTVDDIQTIGFKIHRLFWFDGPVMRLYPNCFDVAYTGGTTVLPYQDQILKARGKELFHFEGEKTYRITDRNIGLILEFSSKSPKNSPMKLDLLNSPVSWRGDINIKIDTIKNEYKLGAGVGLDFCDEGTRISAEIEWKGDLIPDSVKLGAKLEKGIKLPTQVPIYLNNFAFKVSDINKAVENKNWKSLKFTGSLDISSGSLDDVVPKIGKYIKSVSILKMPNTSATIRLEPITVEVEASLYFLEEIKLAEAKVSLGTFDYSNSLLRIDGEEVKGFRAYLKAGLMWNSADDRIKVDISGAGELNAHSRFIGYYGDNRFSYDIDFWLINTEKTMDGEIALGLYTTHDDRKEFILKTRTVGKNGKIGGIFYYIDENGKLGKNNGTL